jgi:DNA replication protein DnaC
VNTPEEQQGTEQETEMTAEHQECAPEARAPENRYTRATRTGSDIMRALLARMPETARARAAREEFDYPREESTEEGRARKELAHVRRAAAWVKGVPRKYRDARMEQLLPEQQPDKLRAWLASSSEVLVLASPTVGNGKTYAAYAVCWAAHEAGQWVCARTAADLMAALRPAEAHEPEIWHTVTKCDLLLIDDLGQDRLTEWTREQLHRLINERNAEGRRTIVTTNRGPREIEEIYGPAIADRLIDEATPIKFMGESRRRPSEW